MSTCEYLAWTQLAVLTATAWLVWRYVRSTERIERAAADQVEATARPVLVPQNVGNQLRLTNVGSGPALRVEWWLVSKDAAFAVPQNVDPHAQIGLIEAKGQYGMMGAPDFAKVLGNNHKVVCLYRSISGRSYLSQGVPREDPVSGPWFDTETVEEKRQ